MTTSPPSLAEASWFDEEWMFLTPPITILLVIVRSIFLKQRQPVTGIILPQENKLLHELLMWGWLSLPTYAFHQFEEHGYDLYGHRYHFIDYFNAIQPWGVSLTPRFITIINVLQVQIVFGLYAWYSERTRNPLCAVLNHGLMVVNACLAHIIPALITQRYNPGMAQSLVMAPTSMMVLYKYYKYTERNPLAFVVTLVFGSVWSHALSLLLPLKLCDLGLLNDVGFIIWAVVAATIYPVMANTVLPSLGIDIDTKGRKE